jgi:hypothetical protein
MQPCVSCNAPSEWVDTLVRVGACSVHRCHACGYGWADASTCGQAAHDSTPPVLQQLREEGARD